MRLQVNPCSIKLQSRKLRMFSRIFGLATTQIHPELSSMYCNTRTSTVFPSIAAYVGQMVLKAGSIRTSYDDLDHFVHHHDLR